MRKNTSVVNERCARCKFHGHLGNGGQKTNMQTLICDYISVVGHSRGCPAGAKCDKFEPHSGKVEKHGPSIVIVKNGEPRGWWSE